MTKWLDDEGIADLLRPGMRVFVGGASNEPRSLIDALAAHPECARGVTFVQFPLPGMNRTDFTALHPQARMESYFMTGDLAAAWESGRLDFVPMQMRRVYDHLESGPAIDLAFIQVAPDGVDFRHGYNLDFTAAALANCRAVVAEVNEAMPVLAGAPKLPAGTVGHALRSARPLPEYPLAEPSEAAQTIGRLIAELIPDGACLQTGIGAIPHAVLKSLGEKNDLGLHGGLLDDAGFALIEAGVVTGTRKAVDTGVHVAGILLGSDAFYQRVAQRPDVRLRGANHTHEVSVIARLENFVSINSALQIDLSGQINAEMAAGRQVSGTGGSLDFMRGAAASPGGMSIVAMPATARAGTTSRIVANLDGGTPVTATRTDVDWVVTEYGAVRLKGQSVAARRELLTGIAAPAFRDALTRTTDDRLPPPREQ